MQDLYPSRGCIGCPLICSVVANRMLLILLESGPLGGLKIEEIKIVAACRFSLENIDPFKASMVKD